MRWYISSSTSQGIYGVSPNLIGNKSLNFEKSQKKLQGNTITINFTDSLVQNIMDVIEFYTEKGKFKSA